MICLSQQALRRRIASLLLSVCVVSLSCSKEAVPTSKDTGLPDSTGWMSQQPEHTIVTIKHDADGQLYFFVTEQYCVYPLNLEDRYPEEVRATAVFSAVRDADARHWVYVHTLDLIETKELLWQADPAFADDPLDIVASWRSCAEDGYLTLQFKTYWADQAHYHDLRLYAVGTETDPYRLRLQQDKGGDAPDYSADALIAFRLTGLPDTQGETLPLTVEYLSLEGIRKSMTFPYKTRKD